MRMSKLYYPHLLFMHSSMPAAAASMQTLTWLLSVVYQVCHMKAVGFSAPLYSIATCQLVPCKFCNKSLKNLNGAMIYVQTLPRTDTACSHSP